MRKKKKQNGVKRRKETAELLDGRRSVLFCYFAVAALFRPSSSLLVFFGFDGLGATCSFLLSSCSFLTLYNAAPVGLGQA